MEHKKATARTVTPTADMDIFDTTPLPEEERVLSNQAHTILAKFGGPRRLASILRAIGKPKDVATIYKWTYPRSKGGTSGFIPTSMWPDLLSAARYDGVLLKAEDLNIGVHK